MGATNCSSCGCDHEQELRNTANIKAHHSASGYSGGPSEPPVAGPRGVDDGLSKASMPDHLGDPRGRGVSSTYEAGGGDGFAEAPRTSDEAAEGKLVTRMETLQDGSVFEGQFLGRDRHGHGRFIWSGGGSYEGSFDANDMHGEGTYIWSDGSKYTGQWQRNNMGPAGVMVWTDGRKYEGQFRDGKKHGEGKLSWPDGRSYVGQWDIGKQHGDGTVVNSKGESRRSRWDHGKLKFYLDDMGAPDVGGTR